MYKQKPPMRYAVVRFGMVICALTCRIMAILCSKLRDLTQNVGNVLTIQHQTCVDEIF